MILQELAPRVGLDEASDVGIVREVFVDGEARHFLAEQRGEDVVCEVVPRLGVCLFFGDLAEAEGAAECFVHGVALVAVFDVEVLEEDCAPVEEGCQVILRGAKGADCDAGRFDDVELDGCDLELAPLVVEAVAGFCWPVFGA